MNYNSRVYITTKKEYNIIQLVSACNQTKQPTAKIFITWSIDFDSSVCQLLKVEINQYYSFHYMVCS